MSRIDNRALGTAPFVAACCLLAVVGPTTARGASVPAASVPATPPFLAGSYTFHRNNHVAFSMGDKGKDEDITVTITDVHLRFTGTGPSSAKANYAAISGSWKVAIVLDDSHTTGTGCQRTEKAAYGTSGNFGPNSALKMGLSWSRDTGGFVVSIQTPPTHGESTVTFTCSKKEEKPTHPPVGHASMELSLNKTRQTGYNRPASFDLTKGHHGQNEDDTSGRLDESAS